MKTSDRVKLLISKRKQTQKKFAETIGISPARLNNYLAGLSNIPQDVLIAISEKYECSLTWLLTGKGDMYNSTHARAKPPGSGTVSLPVYAEIAAGIGIEAEDLEPTETITIPREIIIDIPGPYYCFRVNGDSMEPTLTTDDIAIITRSWHEIDYNGMICAFRNDNGLLIKRVYVAPNAKFGLLIPVNPRHQILKYDRNSPDLILLGILVASIRLHNNT